jgi:MFS family permease
MLLYYLAQLPEFGGAAVSSSIAAVMTAVYFATELVLSPVFGVLSDRFGAQRIMQIGPILGAVAVLITAATTNLWLLGGTRGLEGLAAAASIPSILGYIAIVTSGDEGLRGRSVARFEAATVAGLGVGAVEGVVGGDGLDAVLEDVEGVGRDAGADFDGHGRSRLQGEGKGDDSARGGAHAAP